MTAAGWIWRRAKREATRRISCTDSGSVVALADYPQAAFWGRGRVGLAADGRHHGKGQHDKRDVPMPAVPGTGLVVIETEFVFGRLEAVLDGPALSFHSDQHRDRRAGGAPSGEGGQVAISDIAADQKAVLQRAWADRVGLRAYRPISSCCCVAGNCCLPSRRLLRTVS